MLIFTSLGEQVDAQIFSRNGVVSWTERVPMHEVSLFSRSSYEGTFGTVWWAQWRGQDVTIKKLKTEGLSTVQLESQQATLVSEAALISKLDPHRNIVQFMGLVVEPGAAFAIMTEFCPLGSLHQLLYGGGGVVHQPLPWARRIQLACELARGIEYLHTLQPPVIHRDLKPSNCVLDAAGTLKVCDFGLSRLVEFSLSDAPSRELQHRGAHSSSHGLQTSGRVRSSDTTSSGVQYHPGYVTEVSSSSGYETAHTSGFMTEASSLSGMTCCDSTTFASGPPPSSSWDSISLLSGAGSSRAAQEPLLRQVPARNASRARDSNACSVQESMTLNCGTAHFAAPEVLRLPEESLRPGHYTLSADVYSLGVVLWAICTRKVPFNNLTIPQIMRAVREKQRPSFEPNGSLPEECKQLIRVCWEHDAKLRPSITGAREALERLELVQLRLQADQSD